MKAAFRSDLDFRDLNRGSGPIRLLLLSDLVYDSATLNRTIRVPAKFVTDLASIPQILWNILPPIGAYDAAAVVHDYLYTLSGFERWFIPLAGDAPLPWVEHVTRGQADRVLLEAMEVLDVEWWKRRAIYAGIRIGGGKAWRKHGTENRKAA